MSESIIQASSFFVGRQAELKELFQYLSYAQTTRTPQFVFIEGERGGGKSELVKKFMQEARASMDVLTGIYGCERLTEDAGFGPFISILRSIEDQLVQLKLMKLSLPELLEKMAPELVGMIFPEIFSKAVKAIISEGVAAIKRPAVDKNVVYTQFTRIFSEVLKDKTSILVLEDLHWGDISSYYLLQYLSRHLKDTPLLFICTYRPLDGLEWGKYANELRQVVVEMRSHGAHQMKIAPKIDVKEYISKRYKYNDFSPKVYEFLEEKTNGHPFHLQIFCKLWEKKGYIHNEKNIGDLRLLVVDEQAFTDTSIPTEIDALVGEVIRDLDPLQKKMLTDAAVEGLQFTANAVFRVENIEDDWDGISKFKPLREKYQLIGDQEEILEIGQNFLILWYFSHWTYREHLYNSLKTSEKIILHGRIASILEKLYGDRLGEISGKLAIHYQNARQPIKSAEYALLSAQIQRTRLGWRELQEWCKLGLEQLKEKTSSDVLPLTGRLYFASADGYAAAGELEKAETTYKLAMEVAQKMGDVRLYAKLCDECADALWDQGRPRETREMLGEAMRSLVENHVGENEYIFMQILLALAAYEEIPEKSNQMLATLLQKLLPEDQMDIPQKVLAGQIYRCMANNNLILGNLSNSVDQYQKSMDFYNAVDPEIYSIHNNSNTLGMAESLIWLGQYDKALEKARAGYEMAERHGIMSNKAWAMSMLGSVHFWQGRYEDAVRSLKESAEMSLEIHFMVYYPYTLAYLSRAYLMLGNISE
ncbi:MAG TPA: AAA family ATPase, partial [Nitrosomonas sp.]|nr:AAA family ATPase [Nitrosomonas sp.]